MLFCKISNISVSFDGFKALNDLSLNFEINELRCIIGPNGAGKTTMMIVLPEKRALMKVPYYGIQKLTKQLICQNYQKLKLLLSASVENFKNPQYLKAILYLRISSLR